MGRLSPQSYGRKQTICSVPRRRTIPLVRSLGRRRRWKRSRASSDNGRVFGTCVLAQDRGRSAWILGDQIWRQSCSSTDWGAVARSRRVGRNSVGRRDNISRRTRMVLGVWLSTRGIRWRRRNNRLFTDLCQSLCPSRPGATYRLDQLDGGPKQGLLMIVLDGGLLLRASLWSCCSADPIVEDCMFR